MEPVWRLLLFACVLSSGENISAAQIRNSSRKKPKEPIVARCHRAGLSREGRLLQMQNRSVLVIVQTVTPTKSNICEGVRADWREGLGQCLSKLTGLRVVAQNDDGALNAFSKYRRWMPLHDRHMCRLQLVEAHRLQRCSSYTTWIDYCAWRRRRSEQIDEIPLYRHILPQPARSFPYRTWPLSSFRLPGGMRCSRE